MKLKIINAIIDRRVGELTNRDNESTVVDTMDVRVIKEIQELQSEINQAVDKKN